MNRFLTVFIIALGLFWGQAYAVDFSKLNKLEVTATAYTSTKSQTDATPFLAAWNNKIKPGDRIIAVSRDLLKKGLKNGTKVKIVGLKGYFTVKDKMNKRWKRKIDIYMGLNMKKALNWGKRKVTIIWAPQKKSKPIQLAAR